MAYLRSLERAKYESNKNNRLDGALGHKSPINRTPVSAKEAKDVPKQDFIDVLARPPGRTHMSKNLTELGR